VIIDKIFAMQLDRPVEQLADAAVAKAQEQLIFQRPPVAPGDNLPAASNKVCPNSCSWLLVVVPDHRHPVSQRMECIRAREGSVGTATTAVDEGDSLGSDGIVTVRRAVLIEPTDEADFTGPFAYNDARCEESVRIEADRALHAVRSANDPGLMPLHRPS